MKEKLTKEKSQDKLKEMLIEKPKAKSKEKPKEKLDQTVFIRNLPLDLEEEEFKDFFQKFGAIQIAKVSSIID